MLKFINNCIKLHYCVKLIWHHTIYCILDRWRHICVLMLSTITDLRKLDSIVFLAKISTLWQSHWFWSPTLSLNSIQFIMHFNDKMMSSMFNGADDYNFMIYTGQIIIVKILRLHAELYNIFCHQHFVYFRHNMLMHWTGNN